MKKLFHKPRKVKADGKGQKLGSSASLNIVGSDRKTSGEIPVELSLDEFLSRDRATATYLRVYCEKVRPGDLFKTIKVYGNSTAQRCVKDLVDCYYSTKGCPHKYQLYEVFGRIDNVADTDQRTFVLTFNEVRARPIPGDETLSAVFSSTCPGSGMTRRIELRPCVTNPPNTPPSLDTPVRLSGGNNVPQTESPFRRRSFARTSTSLTLRDSRRHRSSHSGGSTRGPHLLLIRGSNPDNDVLLHDLTKLIQQNRTVTELTVGSAEHSDIRLYPTPRQSDNSTQPLIFAKLVGYDQPLTVTGPSILSGAVYLEPPKSEWDKLDNISLRDIPSIYVNDEKLTQPDNLFFQQRLLRPGDFIYFSSNIYGYVFLFKDPRWVPDYRLELTLPNPEINSLSPRINGLPRLNPHDNIRSDQSSDTDSSYRRPMSTSARHATEKLPRSSCLRRVISNLFTTPLSSSTTLHFGTDPFSPPAWSRIQPWRSAALFAHLVRSTADFIIHPNPSVPNKDVDVSSPQIIRDYATNHVKDMHALLFECHQAVVSKGSHLIYPHLWLSLFCYDLAVLLSPGWLESKQSSVDRLPKPPKPRLKQDTLDENESSGSSCQSPRCMGSIENISVVEELRELAFRLADDSIRNVVKIAFEELSPHIVSFYQEQSPSSHPDYSDNSRLVFLPTSSSDHSVLRSRLEKFTQVFASAFYPCGMAEGERRSHIGSLLHTSSVEGSPYSDGLLNGRPTHLRHRESIQADAHFDDMDNNLSTGTDSESGEPWSKGALNSTGRTSKTGQNVNATERRIEAIVWRQLLACLAHNVLHAVLSTTSITIDWNTGERLVSGVNWLQDWLSKNKLGIHKRPLTTLAEFANLLATPKDQLCKLSWTAMRSIYPEVHPALLKFLLDEYLVETEITSNEVWQVDAHDLTAASESPFDVIDIILDGWRTKECAQYHKFSQRYSPTYRPRNPADVLNLPGTAELVNRLDKNLEEKLIGFRWAGLIAQFPPPHSTTHSAPEPEGIMVSRPESRQRTTASRHRRLSTPRRHAVNAAFTLPIDSDIQVTTPAFRQLRSRMQDNTGGSGPNLSMTKQDFSGFMKPAPSSGEPQRIVRKFGTQPAQFSVASSRELPLSVRETAASQLNYLVSSLSVAEFQKLKQEATRPSTAQGQPAQLRGAKHNILCESQPNLKTLHQKSQGQQSSNFYQSQYSRGRMQDVQAYLPEFSETPEEAEDNFSNKRLYQSLWQLPSEGNDEPKPSNLDPEYGRSLLNVSRDFEKFRQSVLGKGLDRLRSPMFETPTPTPKNPMFSEVRNSIGNLANNGTSQPFCRPPNIIIEEISSGSHSEADSLLLRRDDDLSDVVSRMGHGNTVVNVTLNRPPRSGFGLILVDGERTALDQPGVFVKSTRLDSVAAEAGEIKFGDRILAINGQDLTGMTYSDALKLLKSCETQATFTIRRCYLSDPSLLLTPKINSPSRGWH